MSKYIGNIKMANRLAELRINAGMKQEELAIKLSEMSKRKTILKNATISSWETARRCPSSEFVELLSQLYNVSQAYILGLTDDPTQEEMNEDIVDPAFSANKVLSKRVDPTSLFLYDKKPIYVTFKDTKHLDQWGIYDSATNQFTMAEFTIKANAKSIDTLYSFAPFVMSSRSRPIQNFETLFHSDSVYVKMTSRDKEVINLYDGWYTHNENKTRLINQLGLTLPYSGLNISYYAYIP